MCEVVSYLSNPFGVNHTKDNIFGHLMSGESISALFCGVLLFTKMIFIFQNNSDTKRVFADMYFLPWNLRFLMHLGHWIDYSKIYVRNTTPWSVYFEQIRIKYHFYTDKTLLTIIQYRLILGNFSCLKKRVRYSFLHRFYAKSCGFLSEWVYCLVSVDYHSKSLDYKVGSGPFLFCYGGGAKVLK